MKGIIIFSLTLFFIFPGLSKAEDGHFSIGAGVGSMYSGIGFNLAHVNSNNIKYMSIGCIAYEENSDGTSDEACGVGIGWLNSDLIFSESSNSALGFYAGPVGFSRPEAETIDALYGAGITYAYFFNGIQKPGMAIGITPAYSRYKGAGSGHLLFSVGYQF